MKKKLISYEAFKNLVEGSLSHIENELVLAEEILGKTLGKELELHCFGESDVTYKTADDNFIHAVYKVQDDQIIFENIKELVIDEESGKQGARKAISEMVDAIIENKSQVADQKFDEYFSMPTVRRQLNEGLKVKMGVSKPKGPKSKLAHKHRTRASVLKGAKTRKKRGPLYKRLKAQMGTALKKAKSKLGGTSSPRARAQLRIVNNMKEWSTLSRNVFGYLEYKEFGPVLSESLVKSDNNGNVSAVAIPNSHRRDEGKVLSFQWKTMDTDLKILRGKAKKLNEDHGFVKAVAELKRFNNTSDTGALEEALENVVSKYGDVIYLTQGELEAAIAEAFEIASVKNYDDSTVSFIAEAILRTAHSAYTDRVRKIATAAGAKGDLTAECKECEDAYVEFQQAAGELFSKMDESEGIDMKMFNDLYKALHEMHRIATEVGDEAAKIETSTLMSDCEEVISQRRQPSLELAEEIAEYIADVVESNLPNSGEWQDSGVHTSASGEHPMTAWNAKQTDAVPSKFNGRDEYGVDRAPVSDGKDFGGEDEMAHDALANDGGEHVWPSLSNPYIPEPFTFTMKGDKGADKDQDELSTFQSNDTWPNLQNPMHPKSEKPSEVE